MSASPVRSGRRREHLLTISTDSVMLDRSTPRSSTVIGHGFDAATGEEVTFAADIRAMAPVTKAMARGEVVDCFIKPWQILSRKTAA